MNTQPDAAPKDFLLGFDPHTTQNEEGAANWISTHEAALLLGVSSRSIQRRCHAGKLPARRSQGERGEVWEVAAGAIEGERQGDSDGDTMTATERQMRATATATRATGGRHVALLLPVSRSMRATPEGDGDSDTATGEGDSDGDTRQSVALEAERLRTQLEASRAETQRERELNAFLKAQIEEGNRNAAELRKALNEALKIAPRQLAAGRTDEGAATAQERPQNIMTGTYSTNTRNDPRTSAGHEEQGADEMSADELLTLCRRISQ